MTATWTFDSVTLPHPRVSIDYTANFSSATTNTGREAIQGSTAQNVRIKVQCMDCTLSEMLAIVAKIGTKGTLVLNTETFTNCMIVPPIKQNPDVLYGRFQPEITFARHTA
jgi:hypothetical protein